MTDQQQIRSIEIVRVLGDVSATTIQRLLETGGTLGDLEIAYFCVMGDSDRQEGQLGPLAGKSAEMFDILIQDPVFAPTPDL